MSLVREATDVVFNYISAVCDETNTKVLLDCLRTITKDSGYTANDMLQSKTQDKTYPETQEILSKLNERESIRKEKGVYYTPSDVVEFIVRNCTKLAFGTLSTDAFQRSGIESVEYRNFCKNKTFFDPTCGAGEFLLRALEEKFNLWTSNAQRCTKKDIECIAKTIYGNDINPDSVIISELRLFLCAVERFGIKKCIDIPEIFNSNFTSVDFVVDPPILNRFDLVIGNPPYVEDASSGIMLNEKYGNIYANVLVNAARCLNPEGVFGFIIPLSYVATPRMKKLREKLARIVPVQYVLNYSDRPDCLFTSVHQKLSILICKNAKESPQLFSSNYKYWYKEERDELFSATEIIKNEYVNPDFIPKIGNKIEASIYKKVTKYAKSNNIKSLLQETGEPLFLNMRATFWIKAFRENHSGGEYRTFYFADSNIADYLMCILNSSLFWWYWVCVSDCWHITSKEFKTFGVPTIQDYETVSCLAKQIEHELERTKKYIGTKQAEYAYKHKDCIKSIHEIDDFINSVFGLTKDESKYIKEFAIKYRMSVGVGNESH